MILLYHDTDSLERWLGQLEYAFDTQRLSVKAARLNRQCAHDCRTELDRRARAFKESMKHFQAMQGAKP